MSLFEAARWAPSSYNDQPWRFIYAKKDTPEWDRLFNLLVPFNQSWARNGAVLIAIVSRNTFENNKPSPTHSFDTGAAWENLALQASSMGLVAHGMSGFDMNRARKELSVPDNYTIEAMAVIGKRASKRSLPLELQEKETPTTRKPVQDLIFKGEFKA
jgi:nitroreductase